MQKKMTPVRSSDKSVLDKSVKTPWLVLNRFIKEKQTISTYFKRPLSMI